MKMKNDKLKNISCTMYAQTSEMSLASFVIGCAPNFSKYSVLTTIFASVSSFFE